MENWDLGDESRIAAYLSCFCGSIAARSRLRILRFLKPDELCHEVDIVRRLCGSIDSCYRRFVVIPSFSEAEQGCSGCALDLAFGLYVVPTS